jgi:hypothetical protein
MNITWKINTLERRSSDGYVQAAHWIVTAEDGEYSAALANHCVWPDGQPVIPYENLDEPLVLTWVWANGVDKAAMESALADQIAAQVAHQQSPAFISGVPWSNEGGS